MIWAYTLCIALETFSYGTFKKWSNLKYIYEKSEVMWSMKPEIWNESVHDKTYKMACVPSEDSG